MIVVSDTSPISNLLSIGRLDLLPALFETVYIPTMVWQELSQYHTELSLYYKPDWLIIRAPENHEFITQLRAYLDAGEAASIVLALELKIPTILIDEKAGRLAAQQYQLRPTGLLGVLLIAKEAGLIDSVKEVMAQLRTEAKFYISDLLFQKVIRLAGE